MFIIKEYSIVIKLNEVNKILYSYDIKNDIVDENSKEILTQTNNLIYGKIKSHFNINPKDFGLHINHFTSEEDEYSESLKILNIIKKDHLIKMITQNEIFNYLKNKLKSLKK
ncbi:hypothetical protein NG764_10495 [Aliarcobacter cryaerophilus]|uniref:hypothetical protein n=1 Tax=Aliarcobacter cryaerophilus TaxID=28198 RepID=UPI003DA4A9C9